MPAGCDGSACHVDDEKLSAFNEAASRMRNALQRPVGKLTYEVADQREFDAAVEQLYAAAEIEPLGA